MMTSSNGNIFRVTGHLCREFTGHRWIPRINGQQRGALMLSLICVWINGRVNNREAGDLRRHLASPLWRHCNVSKRTHQNCAFVSFGVGIPLVTNGFPERASYTEIVSMHYLWVAYWLNESVARNVHPDMQRAPRIYALVTKFKSTTHLHTYGWRANWYIEDNKVGIL